MFVSLNYQEDKTTEVRSKGTSEDLSVEGLCRSHRMRKRSGSGVDLPEDQVKGVSPVSRGLIYLGEESTE